ncbi:MAG: hypothetical protein U9Q68_09880 [Euryarchaeota archaeon]|nr:hypothetical protein [Euryarchaeota archaeon]
MSRPWRCWWLWLHSRQWLCAQVCAGVGVAAGATTWDMHQGDGVPIQDAIDGTEAGDTIYVHAGTYLENVGVDREKLMLIQQF